MHPWAASCPCRSCVPRVAAPPLHDLRQCGCSRHAPVRQTALRSRQTGRAPICCAHAVCAAHDRHPLPATCCPCAPSLHADTVCRPPTHPLKAGASTFAPRPCVGTAAATTRGPLLVLDTASRHWPSPAADAHGAVVLDGRHDRGDELEKQDEVPGGVPASEADGGDGVGRRQGGPAKRRCGGVRLVLTESGGPRSRPACTRARASTHWSTLNSRLKA